MLFARFLLHFSKRHMLKCEYFFSGLFVILQTKIVYKVVLTLCLPGWKREKETSIGLGSRSFAPSRSNFPRKKKHSSVFSEERKNKVQYFKNKNSSHCLDRHFFPSSVKLGPAEKKEAEGGGDMEKLLDSRYHVLCSLASIVVHTLPTAI